MERRKLEPLEITTELAKLPAWAVKNGKLVRRFEFADFASSLEFVNQAAVFAEDADHHPDIKLGWGYAEFEITTHDRGGITHFDIALAQKIDTLG